MINEITINGKIEIDQPIDPDTEYSIALKRIQNDQGKVSKWVNKDDVTVYTYKMVNLDVATLISGDKVIKGKAKGGKRSVAMRMTIKSKWEEKFTDIGEEEFYNKCYDEFFKIIENK